MFRLNALYQEKTIFARCKIRIPHNTIHKIMLEFRFTKNKRASKNEGSPGYDTKGHSLSAVYIDWLKSKVNGKQLCTISDDASRKVLAWDEFDNATVENTLE